jgi:hypothetical protein
MKCKLPTQTKGDISYTRAEREKKSDFAQSSVCAARLLPLHLSPAGSFSHDIMFQVQHLPLTFGDCVSPALFLSHIGGGRRAESKTPHAAAAAAQLTSERVKSASCAENCQ